MQGYDLFNENRFGPGDVLNGLTGHWLRGKADEIAGMPRPECNADFAVRLETANTRPVARARIHDHERSPFLIHFDACGRHHPDKAVIDRPIERAAIDDKFHLIFEHMRHRLRQMLAILVATLAHDVEEQHAALSGIDDVLNGGAEHTKRCGRRHAWFHWILFGWHFLFSVIALERACIWSVVSRSQTVTLRFWCSAHRAG